MKIISFASTTPAVQAGRKTRTRRDWSLKHAQSYSAGEIVQAYDKSPRQHGQRFGYIRLTQTPFRQSTALLCEKDWGLEGFDYLAEIGALVFGKRPIDVWNDWHDHPRDMWVVDFEVVELP